MQRIFKCGNMQHTGLLLDNELNISVHGMPFCVVIYSSYKFLTALSGFWPTLCNLFLG